MEKIFVTIVGQDLFQIVEDKIRLVQVNKVNEVNRRMLGNLKTLTLFFEVEEDKVMLVRKHLLERIAQDDMRMMALCPYGEWMRIVVTKPIR